MGRRIDPRYLRVYDKGVETGTQPPGVLWRHELEAKGGLAEVLWNDLPAAPDLTTWCYATVEAQWKSSGCCWPLPASREPRPALKAPEKPPAAAVTLAAWLATSVAPTLPRVLAVYSPDELVRMLGLVGILQPCPGEASDARS